MAKTAKSVPKFGNRLTFEVNQFTPEVNWLTPIANRFVKNDYRLPLFAIWLEAGDNRFVKMVNRLTFRTNRFTSKGNPFGKRVNPFTSTPNRLTLPTNRFKTGVNRLARRKAGGSNLPKRRTAAFRAKQMSEKFHSCFDSSQTHGFTHIEISLQSPKLKINPWPVRAKRQKIHPIISTLGKRFCTCFNRYCFHFIVQPESNRIHSDCETKNNFLR